MPSTARGYDGAGDLKLWSDCAVFRMAPGSANGYVEFYFEMKRIDFEFRRVDGFIRADIYTWVRVTDSAGAPVDSVGGAFVSLVNDSSELADPDFTLFFARALELPPGSYRARTVLVDLADKAQAEAAYTFRVPDFRDDKLRLSDVQLAYDVFLAAPDTVLRPFDVLVKSRYKVYPDCRGLVAASRPRLHFYLEAYNLAVGTPDDSTYSVAFSVVPADGSAVRPLGTQQVRKPGSSSVLASSVGVRDLPRGSYRFRAEVSDPATHQTASVEKPFQVVTIAADSLAPEELERLRAIIAYIARPAEATAFESLNSTGKRNFMVQFWRDRDPTPETPQNEFRDEHMRRLNHANDRFSLSLHDRTGGWRTNQGRVYIVYGAPDLIDRFPFSSGRRGAEVWRYENLPGQGQAYFVFHDEGGYGDYKLVHSSARGEKRDPSWERAVQSGEFEHR